MKYFNHWFWSVLILLVGAVAIYFVNENYKESDIKNRKLKLEYVHNRALSQFSNTIDKFAGMVSGMHAYITFSEEMPNPDEFQKYIVNQLDDINYKDSIVVSFVDTTLTFKFSFTRNKMDPVGLVGKSMASIRDKKFIDKLYRKLNNDRLILSSPLNLVEGWVGLPINFRVRRKNVTIGYIGAIINFKSIIQSMYDEEVKKEFAFHFSTDTGYDFDRERLHDSSVSGNHDLDPEYYKNLKIDTSEFLYSTVTYHGLSIRIGTGYKAPYTPNRNFTSLILSWFFTFMFFVILLSWQINNYKKLNASFRVANELLENKQEIISKQNHQLKKLNEAKNKFFSIIGHDIKGPLSSITGLLKLLQYENITNPDIVELISKLQSATLNTVNLLNNLLRWSRTQTGDMEFIPTRLQINDIVNECVDTLKQQAIEKNIEIDLDLESNISIVGDINMISTIVRNLLSNAIKFTQERGTIIIRTQKSEEQIFINVEDNGIGMEKEEVNNLFRIDKNRIKYGTSGEMGTGLGLLLCKDFVLKHDGKIDVESKPDSGTKFIVSIPV